MNGLRAALGGILVGLSACGGGEAPGEAEGMPTAEEQNASDARAAINASARVLAAITEGDSALVHLGFLEDARIISMGGEQADTSDVARMAAVVAQNRGRFVERIWNPSVELTPESAIVTAPYDFYIDGEFSHCGVDVFTVVRTETDLKVSNLEYTVAQPPACELHPAGPPAG